MTPSVAPDERTLLIGGRHTRVLNAGSGPALVWLHDSFGNRWTRGHDELAAHISLLAPSLPGFERTDELAGIDGPEDIVFWLLDLLPQLGVSRPVLGGGGLGGWMAAEFAVRYPERIGGLVLVDAYGLKVEGALPADEFALTTPQLRPLLFSDPEGALAQEWLPDQEPPERVEQTLRARVGAARLAWQFPYSPKLRTRLGRAGLPACVIWGDEDRLVPQAHAHAWAEGLPDARLRLFEGAGHYPYMDDPAGFATDVVEFMATLQPNPPD
ncbi:MAG: alpha/beta fold hydrolase [Candidatus Dormibacteraeota bacterium]|nr:alpha/beta fold hydrolase [Candidatus Dormibacteraeota bacterium]